MIHAQRGGKLGFAVFLGDLQIEVLVAPDVTARGVGLVALGLDHLAVELGDSVALPVHEPERRAVRAGQVFDKFTDKRRRLGVKHRRTSFRSGKMIGRGGRT